MIVTKDFVRVRCFFLAPTWLGNSYWEQCVEKKSIYTCTIHTYKSFVYRLYFFLIFSYRARAWEWVEGSFTKANLESEELQRFFDFRNYYWRGYLSQSIQGVGVISLGLSGSDSLYEFKTTIWKCYRSSSTAKKKRPTKNLKMKPDSPVWSIDYDTIKAPQVRCRYI